MIGRNALAAASLGALCLLISPRATAQTTPDCSTLTNPIYLAGSTAVRPLIQNMGAALSGTTTLVYQNQGSCTGVTAIANPTPITGTASYYSPGDGGVTIQTCNLATGAGTPVDVGLSDVFAATCANNGLLANGIPPNLAEFPGPTQSMVFVVPTASTETSISADEAYFMFGWGDNDMIIPWNNHNYFFVRNNASGTQNLLAYAIELLQEPAFINNYWAPNNGVNTGSAANVVKGIQTALSNSVSPDLIIGILATEDADVQGPSSLTPLNQLSFQGRGQAWGYLPDSQLGAHDKINTRQGRYFPFGPVHMTALKDTSGNVSTKAKYFIDLVQGNPTTPAPSFNVEDLIIATGLVPDCAMEVSRTAEGGPVALYTHPAPCGCYFEFKATGSTTCAACTGTGQGTCTTAGQQCRQGYCESH